MKSDDDEGRGRFDVIAIIIALILALVSMMFWAGVIWGLNRVFKLW